MHTFPHLLSLMLNVPLMAHQRKAAVVYSALRSHLNLPGMELPDIDQVRIDGLRPERGASEFIGSQPEAGPGTFMRREPFRLDGGVGIISTVGSMVNRGGWIGNDGSGLVSYEGTKFQMARAKQDSRVKAVILDIETPGGQAVGAFELAAAVRDLASVKPVYAVVNGMACSAGYAQISGATRIITTPSGLSGSIGVVMLHLDHEVAMKEAGVTPTFITAGEKKVVGNSLQPLSEDDAAELQAEVNETYELFLDTVAEGRGRALTKAKARDTQAGTFMGRAAVDIGLADDVGTFEEVLAEAQARARRGGGSGTTGQRSASMSVLGNDDQGGGNQSQGNQPAPTAQTFTQAQVDRAVTDARNTATADATRLANERFAAILGNETIAGREAAALSLAIDNPAMSAESVVKFVSTHVPAAATGGPAPRKTIEERATESNLNGLNNMPTNTNPARPGGEQNAEQTQAKAGWDAATKAAREQYEAGLPRQR